MIAAVLMGVGAAVWLAGELYAVFAHETPTTGYVRMFQKRWPIIRVLMVAFLAWLAVHFELGVP